MASLPVVARSLYYEVVETATTIIIVAFFNKQWVRDPPTIAIVITL